MVKSIEIFGDGRIYEMQDGQAISVTETGGEVQNLRRALKFTQAKTFTIAPTDKNAPEVMDRAERRGGQHINQSGLKLITSFEGCELNSYDDGVGVWTIGYGHTKGIVEGMSITQIEAENFLREDLEQFETVVEESVQVQINSDQFSSLVAFSFNVGPAGLAESTLLRLLNAGDIQAAANEFPKWNKAGGQPLLGLTRRRKSEQALFLSQPWEPFLNFQEVTVRVLKLAEPLMNGDDVRQVQIALKQAGINIEPDGSFGKDTDKAVRQFQQQKGLLPVDGIVGVGTRNSLGL
jgi:GH24 family phage-related lysozyme (muramidase)